MEMGRESIIINPNTDRIVFAIIASSFIRIRAYEEAEVRLRKMEEENIDWEEEGENIV